MKHSLITFFSILLLSSCTKVSDSIQVDSSTSYVNLTSNSVNIEVQAVSNFDKEVQWGVAYSQYNLSPTVYDYYVNDAHQGASTFFKAKIQNLDPNTTYYLRPYCKYNNHSYYSTENSEFTTLELPPAPYNVGEDGPAGGTIFYLDTTGYHGMEATYLNWNWDWGCTGTDIPGTQANFGTGENNTSLILSYCASTEAAAYGASTLEFGGFNDWYLPSIHELNSIYSDAFVPGYLNVSSSNSYYSSTQATSNECYALSFLSGGSIISVQKGDPGPKIIAVRNF